MKISELKPNQKGVEVEGTVIEKSDTREFVKFGKPGRVCNAVIEDDSGKITLTLWDEQTEKVSQGDRVKIENGYVSEFKGQVQLSTGRQGTLSVVIS